jgi:hypothetical protein
MHNFEPRNISKQTVFKFDVFFWYKKNRELRIEDDGSGEISGSLIGRRILKKGYAKPALHIGSVVVL